VQGAGPAVGDLVTVRVAGSAGVDLIASLEHAP
jgi:hypothetical protein